MANAANEGHVKESAAREKRGRERDLKDFAFLLGDERGRRWVWNHLATCGVFKLSFNNSGSITAFNEGQRAIGLLTFADATSEFPDLYLLMAKEAKQREANNDA